MDDIREKCSKVFNSVKVVLLDIEGTTTPVTFVTEKLFPYAKENVETFLRKNLHSKEISLLINDLKIQSEHDASSNAAVPKIPSNITENNLSSVVEYVLWLMSLNSKTTALKKLQGVIWRKAYESGEIRGDFYPDVKPALEQWKSSGKSIYIYSSGSVEAQKLLFKHSIHGDMLPLLDGHFDTMVGSKICKESYCSIAQKLGTNVEEIMFLTDVQSEADAAISAGMNVFVLLRPGNKPIEEPNNYTCIDNFVWFCTN